MVIVKEDDGMMYYIDELDQEYHDAYKSVDLLEDVFVDGKLVRDESLSEIRERVLATIE